MPNVVRSREAAIALGLSVMGRRWPNEWWPTGNSAYDDCAAFVSWLLFGLNGQYPYQTYVSGVVERSGLEFHRGAAGLARGDAIGFLWSNDGSNYHHTELALSSPDGAGWFQTIGTNAGPNDDVAIRFRHISNVAAYGRPAYPSTPAGLPGGPTLEDELATVLDSILNAVRRDGGARGRLLFDAGAAGDLGHDKATRAVLIRDGFALWLPENPTDRLEALRQIQSQQKSLVLPWAENAAPLHTTGFNRDVDFLLGPASLFVENVIDLDESLPRTTWQVYSDGRRFPYQSRWRVWEDLRRVNYTVKGARVSRLFQANGKSYAALAAGGSVELSAEGIVRATTQTPSGKVWG